MITLDDFVDIPGYPLYKLNKYTFDILSLNNKSENGKILKKTMGHNGYIPYTLTNESGSKHLSVHRIVMLVKEGPCPEGMIVCHNDGNPRNNHPDNLRYDTYSSNIEDSIIHGTFKKRSKKVTQHTIGGSVVKYWDSITSASIELGICGSGISQCIRGNTKMYKGFLWSYTNITQ